MSSKHLARSLSSQIADHLRDDLLSGFYQTGDPIRQDDVVNRYRVSRTPVREALIQLEHEGLIETTPNRGARVAAAAPDAVLEFLIPVRSIIEVFALRLAFDKISTGDFESWETILLRMREACAANDFGALASADIEFHRAILECASEPSLLRIWTSIVTQVRTYFLSCYAEYDDLMIVYREHAAILEKFRQGNLAEAARYLALRIRDPLFANFTEDLLREELEATNPSIESPDSSSDSTD